MKIWCKVSKIYIRSIEIYRLAIHVVDAELFKAVDLFLESIKWEMETMIP